MESQPSGPLDDHADSSVADAISQALELEQFFLVYQPEFDLHSNAFVGVESLIRWRDPLRGVVSPDVFLPVLEASGQIIPVGRWTLQTACQQGAEWHDKGYRFSVSVNISQRQFDGPELFADVTDALGVSRFPPSHLVLELPQSTLASADRVERLKVLRSLGIRVAIDDIELDSVDVVRLMKAPIDIVKIDRHFVAKVTGPTAAELLHSLVRQAKENAIQVVAAGIEDAGQRDLLQIEQVGVGQGFHFSVPREAGDIDQLLLDFSIFSGKPL